MCASKRQRRGLVEGSLLPYILSVLINKYLHIRKFILKEVKSILKKNQNKT